jgi:hypothetical protein
MARRRRRHAGSLPRRASFSRQADRLVGAADRSAVGEEERRHRPESLDFDLPLLERMLAGQQRLS